MLTLISIPELSTKQVNSGNLLMSHLLLLLITACMSLPNFKKCSVEYNTSRRLYLWFKYDIKRRVKRLTNEWPIVSLSTRNSLKCHNNYSLHNYILKAVIYNNYQNYLKLLEVMKQICLFSDWSPTPYPSSQKGNLALQNITCNKKKL